MRALAVALVCLGVATAATASSAVDVTVLPRPAFPGPARDVSPTGPRLVLVSSRDRDPAQLPQELPPPPAAAPTRFRGADLDFAIRQPPHVFLVYGGRYLVKGVQQSYAFDFVNLLAPPNRGWPEEIRWVREANGELYVENAHLTYARATRNRNAYLTAIDVARKKILWRSRALVANARTFVLAGDLIVSGYGFTAEPDFLYLLDRRTGRVLDRLEVPSAPEIVKRRGDLLYVRTYDRQVVARIVR